MQITYLLSALLVSTLVYSIGLWLVNTIFLEEDEPKKSFQKSVQRLFSDQQMHWIDRWILAENLVAIVLGLFFLTIAFYKGWVYGEEAFNVNKQHFYIPHSIIILLSFLCSIPLAIWTLRLFSLIILFTSLEIAYTDIHWLRWWFEFFNKEKKKGCLYSILRFLHFFVLCIQFLFSFTISYGLLLMIFSY